MFHALLFSFCVLGLTLFLTSQAAASEPELELEELAERYVQICFAHGFGNPVGKLPEFRRVCLCLGCRRKALTLSDGESLSLRTDMAGPWTVVA